MTTQTQFKDFLKDIEPSSTTKSRAKDGHTNLRDFLRTHSTFKKHHIDTFLSGSYKRNTAIRPVKKGDDEERPDVDIIVITNHTRQDDPSEVIDLLYETLSEKYDDIRKQARSIGVFTSTVEMDAVPIIEETNWDGSTTLYIPDRKLQNWIETNPRRHTIWTTEVNKESDGHFKPLVKLLKWWRRENPTRYKKPKGFVIECLAAKHMDYEESYYGELFVKTLEDIVAKYKFYIDIKIVPSIEDPGVPSNSVMAGMSFNEFEAFYNKCEAQSIIGRKAINEEDSEKSLALWRKIFGSRFPASKSRIASSTVGESISPTTFSFPDRAIKPRGGGRFA